MTPTPRTPPPAGPLVRRNQPRTPGAPSLAPRFSDRRENLSQLGRSGPLYRGLVRSARQGDVVLASDLLDVQAYGRADDVHARLHQGGKMLGQREPCLMGRDSLDPALEQ